MTHFVLCSQGEHDAGQHSPSGLFVSAMHRGLALSALLAMATKNTALCLFPLCDVSATFEALDGTSNRPAIGLYRCEGPSVLRHCWCACPWPPLVATRLALA